MGQNSNKNRIKVYLPLALVILAVLTGAFYWYRDYSAYITTDDAHVDADNVTVSSKILGRISALYADEGEHVEKGKLLAVLDSSDLVAQKNQAMALKEQALAGLHQADVKYLSDEQGLRVVEINYEKAREDLERASKQSDGGVITKEQFDHIKKAYEAASAQADASRAMLTVSKAQIKLAGTAAETAEAQVRVIETQLKNVLLFSPADGVISRRWLLPGDIIQPGQSVFTITDDKEKWISAFLEETKISRIHTGQNARFTIDAFPHVRFYGKVILVGSATASVFSLIPANNASGNFTKVTQRIPVRISIESAGRGNDISSYNILNGMSAVVKIARK